MNPYTPRVTTTPITLPLHSTHYGHTPPWAAPTLSLLAMHRRHPEVDFTLAGKEALRSCLFLVELMFIILHLYIHMTQFSTYTTLLIMSNTHNVLKTLMAKKIKILCKKL